MLFSQRRPGRKKPGTPSTRSLTDRASDYGSEGCRFESCRVHSRPEAPRRNPGGLSRCPYSGDVPQARTFPSKGYTCVVWLKSRVASPSDWQRRSEGAYDAGADHVVHDAEFRGQFGGFLQDAVAVPGGEDLDGAASAPGQRRDDGDLGLVRHVPAEHRLVLLPTSPLILVVGEEAPGADRAQGGREEAHGRGCEMTFCPRCELASVGDHTRLPGSCCEPAFDNRQIEQGPRLGGTAPVRSPSRHRHQGLSRWCLRGLAHRWSGACSGQPLGDLPRDASPECRDHRIGVGVQQRSTATTALSGKCRSGHGR